MGHEMHNQSFKVIHKSFLEVMENSIAKTPKDSIIPLKRGYISKINILDNGKEIAEVSLIFNKAFLKIIAFELLGDEEPDLSTLEDMTKELANLVVGHAKVLGQKENLNFTISIPEYVGHKTLKQHDMGIHFKLGRGHCGIYMTNK